MKKTKFRLDIDHSKYLTLEFDGAAKYLDLFDCVTIVYHENIQKYILYNNGFVIESLRIFESILIKTLDGEKVLHESIDRDLGYLWNEYLKDKPGYNFARVPVEKNSTMWVGLRYLLLSSKKCDTWLYNKDGDICFEITPGYKWHFLKPKNNEKYISYGKFIKNYKPIAIIKLEEKVAQQWLKTISKLVKTAQNNYDRLEKLVKSGFYFIGHLHKQKGGGFWRTFKNSKRIGTFDQPLGKRTGD